MSKKESNPIPPNVTKPPPPPPPPPSKRIISEDVQIPKILRKLIGKIKI